MNLSSPLTVPYIRRTSLSFLYMEQSTAFEVKGRLYTTGKVIQRLFIIDLYTELAIYRYR